MAWHTQAMAEEVGRPRSFLATVVGYIVVAIIIWFLFGWLVGTILWILRTVLIILVVLGLITLYFKLKSPKEP
jgi:hypothetical protein